MTKQEALNIEMTAVLFGVKCAVEDLTREGGPEHFGTCLGTPGKMSQRNQNYDDACRNVIEWGMSKRRADAAAGRIGMRDD